MRKLPRHFVDTSTAHRSRSGDQETLTLTLRFTATHLFRGCEAQAVLITSDADINCDHVYKYFESCMYYCVMCIKIIENMK